MQRAEQSGRDAGHQNAFGPQSPDENAKSGMTADGSAAIPLFRLIAFSLYRFLALSRHGVQGEPSGQRVCVHFSMVSVTGYLAASLSSMSIPRPGLSLG